MTITIDKIFPNFKIGLQNIGFYFGAGTSVCAGYPVGSNFTKDILENLTTKHKKYLKGFFDKKSIPLSIIDGEPDIEIITDIIIKEITITGNMELKNIEKQIRQNIVILFLSIDEPNISFHIKFFNKLKSMYRNRDDKIWIFTTNYDLLFEHASALAKISINNGFEGISTRYFDPNLFDLKCGRVNNSCFYPFREPAINLIKLHGSISWYKKDENVFELFDKNIIKDADHVLIQPRREKILSTLENPYESLFRYAIRTLGEKCKFLVCCGSSLRDEHINEQLLFPKLRENKLRVFALFQHEPENIKLFKQFPSFHYLTSEKSFINGEEHIESSDLWQFDKFIEFLNIS